MWDEIIREAVTLFVVIDPIGTVPLFLAVTKGLSPPERRWVAVRGTLIAAGILLGFIVGGQVLLRAMDIHLYAFQIAGGIVLFVFGLKMIFETESKPETGTPRDKREVAVFPLAVPSIAGPGAMMAVVLLTDDDRHSVGEQAVTTVIMFLILLLTLGLLLAAGVIQRLIGETGANIVSRVMGLILTSLAVETVLAGLKAYGWG